MGMGIWVLLLIVVLIVLLSELKKLSEQKARRVAAIADIARDAQKLFDKIVTLKTMSARQNASAKALAVLTRAEAYPECREVIRNYDEQVGLLRTISKILPVAECIEKADKQRFKGRNKAEMSCLLDALYEARIHNVTDRDFDTAKLTRETPEQIINIADIERRLRQLGWTGESDVVCCPSGGRNVTTGTFHSKVAGVTFRNDDGSDRQDYIRSYCRPGSDIILKREPDNPYDSNAVAVWVKGNVLASEVQIGYLKAEVAEEIADYMDGGGVVEAQITEVTGGTRDKPTFGVNISLELPKGERITE